MQAVQVKSDAQIQRDVLAELKWDSRIDETDVGVEVDRGVVTLTGTVNTYPKRLAAQAAAHRVKGVLDVANNIQVRVPGTPGHTDTAIAQDARQALKWDVVVPHERIQTTVSQGNVTLEGTVNYWHQKEAAEQAVRNLSGVRSVLNKLAVARQTVATQVVKKSIEDALERRAERAAGQIAVAVEGGTVKLSGRVRSWQEKEAVVGAARFTSGVQYVEDSLRIDPAA